MAAVSLLTLVVLGLCCCVVCFEGIPIGSPCKHTFPSGKTYDFTGAKQAVGEVSCFSGNGYRFTYAPCGVVSEPNCNSPIDDQSACQTQTQSGGFAYGIGERSSISFKQESADGKGFTAVLTGGLSNRQTTIQFQCDRSTTGSLTCGTPIEGPSLNYNLIFTSKYACAVGSGGGGSSSTSSDSGLSGGWIFIITLSSIALVYFVGGVLFQKFYKKEKGLALLPNVEFWKMLPGLVKDGIYFSLNKVKQWIDAWRGQKNYDTL
ncbi:Autophagy-related protein 27 [Balamuthia mandrillaris]